MKLRADTPPDLVQLVERKCPRDVPHENDGDLETECLCHVCCIRRFVVHHWKENHLPFRDSVMAKLLPRG